MGLLEVEPTLDSPILCFYNGYKYNIAIILCLLHKETWGKWLNCETYC